MGESGLIVKKGESVKEGESVGGGYKQVNRCVLVTRYADGMIENRCYSQYYVIGKPGTH